MSLNDKYAYIVLSFLTFLNSLAVSKYFRFLVIPKNKGIINKKGIIYLDGDTLTLKDLTKMYNSDFDNNYVLGVLGIASWGLDYLGIKAKNWIKPLFFEIYCKLLLVCC